MNWLGTHNFVNLLQAMMVKITGTAGSGYLQIPQQSSQPAASDATYTFTIPSSSITAGTTYTNNGVTYTVLSTTVSSTSLACVGNGAPTSSGTLTFVSGSPSGNLSFSAVAVSALSNRIYPDATGNWWSVDSNGVQKSLGGGSSGGSSVPNYVLQTTFEDGQSGNWLPYVGGTTTPTNGYGGSPTHITSGVVASTVFGSTKALQIAKGAVNYQGEGVAYGNSAGFVVAGIDLNKPMNIQFDYTFSGAVGDCTVYLYDVTNSVLITPSITSIQPTSTGATFNAFAIVGNGTNYRLIFHAATTTPSAWTLMVDNVSFSRNMTVQGAAIGAWKAFTPTGAWVSNATYTGFYREVGSSVEVEVKVAVTGTPTSATLSLNMPTGYTINTSALTDQTNSSTQKLTVE